MCQNSVLLKSKIIDYYHNDIWIFLYFCAARISAFVCLVKLILMYRKPVCLRVAIHESLSQCNLLVLFIRNVCSKEVKIRCEAIPRVVDNNCRNDKEACIVCCENVVYRSTSIHFETKLKIYTKKLF